MAFWKAKLFIAAAAALALFSASSAKADTACESLPSPIYLQGSSASAPLWNALGPILADAGTTLVYQKLGSCIGVQDIEAIQNGDPGLMASGANASTFWLLDGGTASCTATNDPVDVGVSDVFQSTCDLAFGTVGAPVIGRFNGATQVMTFIRPVDAANNQMPNEISAEQAYFVLAGPAGDGIAPWNQPTENITLPDAGTPYLFIRDYTSGTQSMIAEAVLLNPKLFSGVNAGGTGTVISDVAAATGTANDQSVMGIAVAGGGYDSKRSTVQALAVRGFQQSAAWLPDSTAASFDKRNVRAGLYTISGPLQLLFAINGGTDTTIANAANPKAVVLVNYLNGSVPLPNGALPITQYEIGASFVPDCAMGVTRFDNASLGGNTEGAIVPNTSRQHSCDCYFESKVTNSTVTCTACTGAAGDCAGGVCGPNGVCEAF